MTHSGDGPKPTDVLKSVGTAFLAGGEALKANFAAFASEAQAACHPSDDLSRVLAASNYLSLSSWINDSGEDSRVSRELRHAKYHAAVELAKLAVTVDLMRSYAIRQVIDAADGDLRCDYVARLATAYAAIHVVAAGPPTGGPATGGILSVVRSNL